MNGAEDQIKNIDACSLKATINNVEYEWVGGYGAVITSKEKGLKVGDMRSIGGIAFEVSYINPRKWRSPSVSWHPVEDFNMQWVKLFKAKLFGIDNNLIREDAKRHDSLVYSRF